MALCKRACKEALKHKVEAEAYSSWRRETETEIEGDNITIGTGSTDFGIGIRVLNNRRIGFAYTSVPKDIPNTVRRAMSASRLSVEVDFKLAPSARFRRIRGLHHEEVLGIGPKDAFSMTREIIEGAHSHNKDIMVSSGGLLMAEERMAIVNTRGLETFSKETVFSVSASTVAGTREKTSGFESGTSRSASISPFEIGKKAAELALGFQGGSRVKDGKMDVLFKPSAMAEILDNTLIPSLRGDRIATGESYLRDRLGKKVTWGGLTIKEDPLRPHGLGSAICDDEGTRSRTNLLIDRGILRSFIYDLASAAKYGAKSTGNGLRPGFRGVPSTSSRSIVVEGRNRSFDKILSNIDRGVLVHDVMGAHTANKASTDFSVNSAALFMIEKGELSHPLSNAMISGNLGEMLNRIGGLADDVRAIPDGAAYYLPTIWFKKVQVNG